MKDEKILSNEELMDIAGGSFVSTLPVFSKLPPFVTVLYAVQPIKEGNLDLSKLLK